MDEAKELPMSWFGNLNILERFSKENEDFLLSTFPCLQQTFILVQEEISQIKPLNKTQTTLYTLSMLIYEDFSEISLLCGFGMGSGAKKILRGMFERTVTLCYLGENPSEVENFWRYGEITARKRAMAQKKLGRISDEEWAKIEEQYQNVRERFLITDCRKCNTKKVNISWSKVDMATMAEKVGLYSLIDQLYYDPMQETHTSVSAFRARYKLWEEEGSYHAEYKFEPDWEELKILLERANYLFHTGLMTIFRYFNFSSSVKQAIQTYNESTLDRLNRIP